MTRHIAIIGYPLKHSISPAFQQAALDGYKLDVRYEAWETRPEQLEAVVEKMRQPDCLGANVTVPHKEAVLSSMDELEGLAARIGAVNTIVNREGKLVGHNTDAEALLRALREDGGFEPGGKRVVLLGAGGVARAASFVLIEAEVDSLTIVNRSLPRAEALAISLAQELKPGRQVTVLPQGVPAVAQRISICDLLVNCTSVGMRHSPTQGQLPLDIDSIPEGALVYDLVYNPIETPLLASARKRGARALGGLPMLVYQGAASFALWTGKEALLGIMFQAAKRSLSDSGSQVQG